MFSFAQPMDWDCLIVGLVLLGAFELVRSWDIFS
jgi:hypothetical protein